MHQIAILGPFRHIRAKHDGQLSLNVEIDHIAGFAALVLRRLRVVGVDSHGAVMAGGPHDEAAGQDAIRVIGLDHLARCQGRAVVGTVQTIEVDPLVGRRDHTGRRLHAGVD